jgi:hypothetical protein
VYSQSVFIIKSKAMKKIILSLSLMLAVGVSVAFANAEPVVNEKVKASFQKEFAAARLVTWTEAGDLLKASFVLGEHRAVAYFTEDGSLEGCARDLFYDQLPILVMKTLDNRYPNAAVIDVTEIVNADGASYRLTLEFNDKKYRIKADTNGNIIESQKLK